MSDIHDILGFKSGDDPKSPMAKKTTAAPPPITPKRRKPTGLAREFDALQQNIMQSMPSLVPSILRAAEQDSANSKRNITKSKAKAEKWVWASFKSPARKDNAEFSHWVKARDMHEEHKFAKYNKIIAIDRYTDEEYKSYFTSQGWSKEETDYLLDLCEKYDTRFVVIADRWQTSTLPAVNVSRDVEALKERFYYIERVLMEKRGQLSPQQLQEHPLVKHPYTANQDRSRKQQNEVFVHRSPEEVKAEQALIDEWTTLNDSFKKQDKEADKLVKLVQKVEKETKKKSQPPKPGEPKFAKPLKPKTPKLSKNQPLNPVQYSLQKYQKPISDFLRSSNINPNGLSSMTNNVLNELKNDLALHIELEKAYTKKEYELQVLKEYKKMLLQSGEIQVNLVDVEHVDMATDNVQTTELALNDAMEE